MLTSLAIPDPRRYPDGSDSPLALAAQELTVATAGLPLALEALARDISAALARGEENTVRDAVRMAPSAPACRVLQRALDLALTPAFPGDTRGDPAHGVGLHLFALPVLLVVGASSAHRIRGVLPDTDSVRALFDQTGALGHCRNFGLSNALTALEQLETIPWLTLHSIAQAQSWAEYAGLELPPANIDVQAGGEAVHLRFVSGAALTPADAPGFVESAGDIGRWGMPLTKELGRQLAVGDVSLLAIPRPPRSIFRAMQEGWFAVRELGFQLFLSNALRQARSRIGEPDITITACADQSIRIHLTSAFDDLLDQAYGWPLSPADDLDEIANSISTLLDEAQVGRWTVNPLIEDGPTMARPTHQ